MAGLIVAALAYDNNTSHSLYDSRSHVNRLMGYIKTAEQRTTIQQYGDWYTSRLCTKCNNAPINGQCINFIKWPNSV